MVTWFTHWSNIKRFCLFGVSKAKLTKNVDLDKYYCSWYNIRCNSRWLFLSSNFDIGKNVLIYGVDNSPLVHNDNRKKDILFVVKGPAAALEDTTKRVEVKYFNNFFRSKK